MHINNLKYNKILIDLTKSSFKKDEPMVGALELINFMNSIGIPPKAKLAFIFSEAEHHRKYFEGIANTGGFNIQYFKNLHDATSWLDISQ